MQHCYHPYKLPVLTLLATLFKEITQDLNNGKRNYGKKTQQDAGNRSKSQHSSEVNNYKVLLPTDADARFERSTDVVLSMRDNTYFKILEPHLRAFWEDRDDPSSEGAMSRARRVFVSLEEELQQSGGGFYKARNPKAVGDAFWKADNLYLVTDEEARKSTFRFGLDVKNALTKLASR